MTTLLLLIVAAGALGVGGAFYSRFLARRLGEDPSRPTPAIEKADGVDYVPTPTPVVFAHHFASVAGAGPILGPVIAIVYGWVPALIWVVLGGLFIGALRAAKLVHGGEVSRSKRREHAANVSSLSAQLAILLAHCAVLRAKLAQRLTKATRQATSLKAACHRVLVSTHR